VPCNPRATAARAGDPLALGGHLRRWPLPLAVALVLALGTPTVEAPPARADDAAVRQRIAANDVHVSDEVHKLRVAIRAFESLAHRTALTVLAFRRLSHHSLVVAYTALDLVYVDQVFLGKLEGPDVALDATDQPTAQGVNLMRGGIHVEESGLRYVAASYRDLSGELNRIVAGDRAGAKRALKRATHAVSASLPILARADRFGAKAQGLLGVPLDDIFF
jgi:hypothetical protein